MTQPGRKEDKCLPHAAPSLHVLTIEQQGNEQMKDQKWRNKDGKVQRRVGGLESRGAEGRDLRPRAGMTPGLA